jgi:ArsR family transcriptional regulator, arsenate/arsenite/antimonite-responsive transcriptional repressor / arsenate reductase (thioredoxin)
LEKMMEQETSSQVHPTQESGVKPTERTMWQFVGHTPRVLFLCVSNSARSQIAEALTNSLSRGQVQAFSAGSHPAEQVHPYATAAIARLGVDLSQHVPKHLDTFVGQPFDRVVTLCDPEHEECPLWPGSPDAIQWNFPDPLQAVGTGQELQRVFDQLAVQLNMRVRLFLTLLEREQKEALPDQESTLP